MEASEIDQILDDLIHEEDDLEKKKTKKKKRESIEKASFGC